MSSPFTPAAWFWTVAGDTTRVYSSAAAAYVPVADAGHVAWLAAGNRPTRIDTEASLADVLRAQHPAGIGTLGPRYVPLATIRERVTAAGKWLLFAGALDTLDAEKRWHLLTLSEGVASDDADALALLTAIGCTAADILAP